MKVSIREFQKDDALSIAFISCDEWANKIFSLTSSLKYYDGQIVRCFVDDGIDGIVGFIYGYILPDKLLIPEFLYVIPEYRKKGIAAQLLNTLEKESNCTASMIFYNKSLRNHYEKQGYQVGDNLEVAMKQL